MVSDVTWSWNVLGLLNVFVGSWQGASEFRDRKSSGANRVVPRWKNFHFDVRVRGSTGRSPIHGLESWGGNDLDLEDILWAVVVSKPNFDFSILGGVDGFGWSAVQTARKNRDKIMGRQTFSNDWRYLGIRMKSLPLLRQTFGYLRVLH